MQVPALHLVVKLLGASLCFLLLSRSEIILAQEADSAAANDKKLHFGSGITMSAQFYHMDGATARQQPFMYAISGTPSLSYGNVAVPFTLLYSNQVLSFQQPFNRFGISPRFDWGTIYLGSSSMRFSNYTLAGQRFDGAGADLQLGILRIGAMYGRFSREVRPDNAVDDPETFINEAATTSFLRTGYAAKFGLGTRESYVDFVYLNAADQQPAEYDYSEWEMHPAQNVVLGIRSVINAKGLVVITNDWAASAYTRDQFADSIEIEDAFIRSVTKNLLTPNQSTQLRFAGESAITLKTKYVSPGLLYKRIELDYKTMGAYYFLNDIEQYQANLSFRFLQNKLTGSGSFGQQHDNLQDHHLSTSRRNIGALSLNYTPSAVWGVSGSFSNFGITTNPLPTSLADTTRLKQVSNTFSLVPRYQLLKGKHNHLFTLVSSYSALNNLGDPIGEAAETTSLTNSLSYSWTWVPYSFQTGCTPTFIRTTTILGEYQATGVSLQASKAFLAGKVSSGIQTGVFANSFNQVSNGRTVTAGIQGSVNWPKWPGASLGLQYMNNQSADETVLASFRELYANISINYNF